jgi:hypothetical protein
MNQEPSATSTARENRYSVSVLCCIFIFMSYLYKLLDQYVIIGHNEFNFNSEAITDKCK